MSTVTRIGPRDQGREMTYEEFLAGDYEEGSKYELIEGKLAVAPAAEFSHFWDNRYLVKALEAYAEQHPQIVGFIGYGGVRVFVPGARRTTVPEPDVAVYRELPVGRTIDWRQISPMIVVEIVSASDPDKDFVRNVELYAKVPSILEYWIFDHRHDQAQAKLHVYYRPHSDAAWLIDRYQGSDIYSTSLLPGFKLSLDSSIP